MSDETIEAAIERELESGCRGRPAKRAALELAQVMLKPRHEPWELCLALEHVRELRERMLNAKVV